MHYKPYLLQFLTLLFISLGVIECRLPAPLQRSGPGYNGSAYWAKDLAQPRITAFAPDPQIYSISGAVADADAVRRDLGLVLDSAAVAGPVDFHATSHPWLEQRLLCRSGAPC